MVTASDLEKLNVINDKSEKDIHYSGSFIPDSISWMLPPERTNHNELNSPVTKLRNKRLHYLFESHNGEEQEEPLRQEDAPHTDITTASTSFDYPTTQLKTHELTNKLEFELMESSFFGKNSETSHQSEWLPLLLHFHKNTQGSGGSSFLHESSFHSILTSNLILPQSREMEFASLGWGDYPELSRDSHLQLVSRFRSHAPVVASNPRKHGLSNSPTARPTKKFKSRSQCDLVFPNLEFRKAG
ncbi:hypothetical protein Cantr_05419 [Candida viswanathii]|uniref:Uncharacterized protein n=1 Tax=Candida viswanathii TaxID=5486 RepID=A0A367XRC0_9ASCO|nr:hypothetical protein Cantr_05419 [Candida viswanathii]